MSPLSTLLTVVNAAVPNAAIINGFDEKKMRWQPCLAELHGYIQAASFLFLKFFSVEF